MDAQPTPSRQRWLASLAPLSAALLTACGGGGGPDTANPTPQALQQAAMAGPGKQVFRYETFGDEAQWTDRLRMHEVISQAVDPLRALSVGLKVDSEALPPEVVAGIQSGAVDLASPATTVALIKLDAVVGIKGTVETVNGRDVLKRVGVTCALCHSTVDNAFMQGIGKRLDGWPNRDLNPGAIIALSPALPEAAKAIYNSWGPGKYDPRFNIDGQSKPVVIPPAYGLQGIHRITFTGDGDAIEYWNRYVAVTQMGGLGTFTDPRVNLSITNGTVDLVTDNLKALQAYQLTLQPPLPPAGSFDPAAAMRGRAVFVGRGMCITCHTGGKFTDANQTLHPPSDSMAEPETPSYAARSATKQYRTSPLRGVWQHAPYFHDGSAATLEAVGERYNTKRGLGLSEQEIADLAQYLKSL